MKIIISESKLFFLRRLQLIDRLLSSSLNSFDRWHFSYVDVDYIINFLKKDMANLYFFETKQDFEVGGEKYKEMENFIEKYLNSNWRDKINELLIKKKKIGFYIHETIC